jgi:hypothetical protein
MKYYTKQFAQGERKVSQGVLNFLQGKAQVPQEKGNFHEEQFIFLRKGPTFFKEKDNFSWEQCIFSRERFKFLKK